MRVGKVKSALLKTSAITDVKRGGGVVTITGLDPFRQADMLSMTQFKYHAEVQQVQTIGSSSYTPTASTKYTVLIGSPDRAREGNNAEYLKAYSYTTPPVITTLGATAALQREAIHVELVAKINADSRNYTVAATLGTGTGFTITDDAGYYPARLNGASNGRTGANQILLAANEDGTGFIDSADRTVTTTAVYGFGVGSRMDDDAPTIYAYGGGNLISGELDAPVAADGTYAVSGQQYDAFKITSMFISDIPTISNSVRGFQTREQAVFVDNGAGTATTNATGFLNFEREMQRLLFSQYENDPATIVDFFDNGAVFGSYAVAGTGLPTVNGVPSGAAGDINVMNTGKNVFHYSVIGTATAITPILASTGLNLDQDATDNDGIEIAPPVADNCPKQFTVGKDEFSLFTRVTITDVSDVEFLFIGFRKKEAFVTADGGYDTYTDLAAIGFNAEAATQVIAILTNLNNAAAHTATDTGLTWADAAVKQLEIRVLRDRSVKFIVNGVDQTADQATAFSFDDGDVVIPFIYHQLGTSSAPSVVIDRLAVVPDAYWRIL